MPDTLPALTGGQELNMEAAFLLLSKEVKTPGSQLHH
jgi:hypothetical protein